jgi:hypothetical protein
VFCGCGGGVVLTEPTEDTLIVVLLRERYSRRMDRRGLVSL